MVLPHSSHRRFWSRLIFGVFVVSLTLGILGWWAINSYVNRPGFQQELQKMLSDALQGSITFQKVSGSVGFSPRLVLEGLNAEIQGGGVHLKTDRVTVLVEWRSLLRKRLILSSLRVEKPSLVVTKSKGGVWPFSQGIKPNTHETERMSVKIQKVELTDAILSFINPDVSPKPVFVVQGDLQFEGQDDRWRLVLNAFIRGNGGVGKITVDGIVSPVLNLTVTTQNFPINFFVSYVPFLKDFRGGVDGTARVWKENDRFFWETTGEVQRPLWIPTQEALPLFLQWKAQAEGTSTVTLTWVSPQTQVVAVLTVPDWKTSRYAVSLTGDCLSLTEMTPWAKIFSVASSSGPSRPYDVSVVWNVAEVRAGLVPFRKVAGSGRISPGEGVLQQFTATGFGGPVSLTGSWRTDKKNNSFVSGKLSARSLNLDTVETFFSSVPLSGSLSLSSQWIEFPLPTPSWSWTRVLNSLSRARNVEIQLSGKNVSVGHDRPLDVQVMLKPLKKQWVATMTLSDGDASLTGHFQSERSPKAQRFLPHNASLTLSSMDVSHHPRLMEKIGLSEGFVSGTAHWSWTGGASPSFFWSPSVVWGVNLSISRSVWRQIRVDHLNGIADWRGDGVLRFTDVVGRVSNGDVVAQGKWPIGSVPAPFSLDLKVHDLDVGPVALAFSSNPKILNGQLAGTLSLTGQAHPWNNKTLEGSLSIEGKNGNFNAGPVALDILSFLKLGSLLTRVTGQRRPGLPFDVFSGSAPIHGGRFFLDHPFVFKNQEVELAYTGWLDADAQNARGVLIVNALTGTRNLLKKIPGVSAVLFGPNGEFLPLVVDVSVINGKTSTRFRSVRTFTAPVTNVIKNIFKLPKKLLGTSPP